jgi:phosphatidylinositol alpha-mannosyltransferase
MVGTFHAASSRKKIAFAITPFIEPVIEKLNVRIAVSEAARKTLQIHLDTDAVVIPNGIYAKRFADAVIDQRWVGNTIGFIGRFEESRKGLSVLIEALHLMINRVPDLHVFVAGPGNPESVLKDVEPHLRKRFTFLGRISEAEKASLMASVGLYVAPNTGGESFGIILAEALASGACVLASDIPAFASLLGDGEYGTLFASESPADLADKAITLFADAELRHEISKRGQSYANGFDWDLVAERIYDVYEMSMVGGSGVRLSSDGSAWSRLLGRGNE